MLLDAFLLLLGVAVGVVGGMLGIGGGTLTVPALIFLPPLWGAAGYNIHLATGISALQCLVTGMAGVWTHHQKGMVKKALVYPIVFGGLLGGLIGGLVSGFLPAWLLYAMFVVILLATLVILLFFPQSDEPASDSLGPAAYQPQLQTGRLFVWVLGISFLASNTGIGGAILLLPVLTVLLKVPTRVAIATGSWLVTVTSFSAVIGKGMMHMVPLPDALWVAVGGLLGGKIGAELSHQLSTQVLRILLAALVVITLIRLVIQLFSLT